MQCGHLLFADVCQGTYEQGAKGDAAFLSMAAQADMTAAHLGKMAQDRGAENPVKDFGKTLVTDHTDDYHQLTELSNKIGEAIPKAIDKRQ